MLTVESCSMCAQAWGKIKTRDNQTLWGTDQECKLRQPDDPFYKRFAAECSRVQIAVDVFAMGCAHLMLRLVPESFPSACVPESCISHYALCGLRMARPLSLCSAAHGFSSGHNKFAMFSCHLNTALHDTQGSECESIQESNIPHRQSFPTRSLVWKLSPL